MDAIIAGGCAILLGIELPENMRTVAEQWIAQSNNRSLKTAIPHMTIAFIGRDLPESIIDRVILAADEIEPFCPRRVELTGGFVMFGRRLDHLVATVERSLELDAFVTLTDVTLSKHGVWVKRDFGEYRPHMTLATGSPYDSSANIIFEKTTVSTTDLIVKVGAQYHRMIRSML